MFSYGDEMPELKGAANDQGRGMGIPDGVGELLREELATNSSIYSPEQLREIEDMSHLVDHMFDNQTNIPQGHRRRLLEEKNVNYLREYTGDRQSEFGANSLRRLELRRLNRKYEKFLKKNDNNAQHPEAVRLFNEIQEASRRGDAIETMSPVNYWIHRNVTHGILRPFREGWRNQEMYGIPSATMTTLKWAVIPSALVVGGTKVYDMLFGDTPEADNIEDARELSKDYVNNAQTLSNDIEEQFDLLKKNVTDYRDDLVSEIDELIAESTDEAEKAQYRNLKNQVTEASRISLETLERDQQLMLQNAQNVLQQVEMLDQQIQTTTDLTEATSIFTQQHGQLRAFDLSMVTLVDQRALEIETMKDALDAAVVDGKPAAALPGLVDSLSLIHI